MLINKRRVEREQLDRYIRVFNRDTGEFAGFLVDVTTEGAMLGSIGPLDMSAVSRFDLQMPGGAEASEKVALDAQGVWGNKGENSIFYETGFRFLSIKPEVRRRIEGLIQSHRLAS